MTWRGAGETAVGRTRGRLPVLVLTFACTVVCVATTLFRGTAAEGGENAAGSLRVRELVLVTGDGQVMAKLACRDGGGASLELMSAAGRPGVTILTSPEDGCLVSVVGSEGNEALLMAGDCGALTVRGTGGRFASLGDGGAKSMELQINAKEEGGQFHVLVGEGAAATLGTVGGKGRVRIASSGGGLGELSMRRKDGTMTLNAIATPTGGALLQLFDRAGKLAYRAPGD